MIETTDDDADRRELVEKARKAWIDQLVDRSRRNNLLYFRDLKTGTLDFSGAEPNAIAALLAEEAVPLNRLLPDADLTRAAAVLREIHRRALANLEEKGLQTLFLALGMATWPASDEGRPPEAAVLLVPVAVEWRGRESRSAALKRAGEAQVNLVLLQALEAEHGCRVAPEALLPGPEGDAVTNGQSDSSAEHGPLDPAAVYRRLRDVARGIERFDITERAVLGNFSFQKMAMVNDLRELGEGLEAHDVIAAMAGDIDAGAALRSAGHLVDRGELDRVPPGEEYLVLDADSSQQAVVHTARTGRHLVIQGPPGTGKSQTIANLIATLAAEGRRVLFVAEKRAALEVVLGRLRAAGLDHLALDLHGAELSRRAIMARLGSGLQQVHKVLPVDADGPHEQFADRRARLNEHAARIHTPRPPSGRSLYSLEGELLRLPEEARSSTRWRGAALAALDAAAAGAISQLLREAAGFDRLFTGDDPSPWTGARLTDGAAAQQAVDAVGRIVLTHWPALEAAIKGLVPGDPSCGSLSLEQIRTIVGLVHEISQTLASYRAELFHRDLTALEAALAPARGNVLVRAWATISNPAYRCAGAAVRALRQAGPASMSQFYQEVAAAADQAKRWRALFPGVSMPQAPVPTDAARQALDALQHDLALLTAALPGRSLGSLPLTDLHRLLLALREDSATPHRIPRLLQVESEIDRLGARAIIDEIRARRPDPRVWHALFESARLVSCLEQARIEDPAVAGFNGSTHEETVAQFRALDRDRLKLASQRVRRAHAESVIRAMNEHPDQASLINRETAKKTRHLPLRALLRQAPDVLTALCPCWMASPLSVSQLLPVDRRYFDVVIVDEASQVLPHDAVPAILRATQVIVAGDEHQLSPTLFFADGGGDDGGDGDGAPTAGFESLLQLMRSVVEVPLPLQWHYRSRDESLITFSNRHIYRPNGQEMITLPGPRAQGAVTHALAPQAPGADGQEESGSEEVRRVVELVLEHAETRPGETLGVIAMGIKHAQRIQAALDEALRQRPDLEAFFEETRPERFFVKNLERVQGDERDAIILSVGYGKDRAGRLPYRFGPLNQEGGHRRLNVAVTRARARMTLVSSFSHHDMDPSRSTAKGVELLRLYLQFVASGGKLLGDTGVADTAPNGFEADIEEALMRRGIPLLHQWGASRYRIDLVAQHPERPGRFVLAIECDGATYHSAHTARDRDRLRQQQLEALGWRFHRIWSTDWFMRREAEIERAWAAFQAAVVEADRADAAADTSAACPPVEATAALPVPESLLAAARGPRPAIPAKESILHYQQWELISLIEWIKSDGRLRTDDEVIAELTRELGFHRRGPRIEAACREAIRQVRSDSR